MCVVCEYSGFLPFAGKKAGGARARVEEARRPLPGTRCKARSQGEQGPANSVCDAVSC